ncbi:hypothetical protein ACTHGU_16345 [Chitinophagaceae bacterium MMS25-I14]
MKALLAALAGIALSVQAFAGDGIVIDKGKKEMKNGLGDYCEIAYAFAKGDKVHLEARSSKMLERATIVLYPQKELGKIKFSKKIDYDFTMPEEGVVLVRFVSDRGGKNSVDYTVTRIPGSDDVKDYDTTVKWEKPSSGPGTLVPVRAVK